MGTVSFRLAIAACMLPASVAIGQEPGEKSLSLPNYIASATVLNMSGNDFSYVPVTKGDRMLGFGPRGTVGFTRPAAPDFKLAIRIAHGELLVRRVHRRPNSGEIIGIELGAESKKQVSTVTTPDRPRKEEIIELRQVTRIDIIPKGDKTTGTMWIVHSDDVHGGILYTMQLQCVLKPEFFPVP